MASTSITSSAPTSHRLARVHSRVWYVLSCPRLANHSQSV